MRNYIIKSFLAVACLALVSIPLPVRAQSSDLGMSISVNPTSTSPGGTVGVFAIVTNYTSKNLKTTVTFTSLSPCGTETSLGYNRLSLYPGQTVWVTVSYPIPPDACPGMYSISISEKSGGKPSGNNAAQNGATCYLSVN
ncbi:MAG TPA: hypothetical protein VK208_09945 [Pyrinomonadaceae bacterium]|nr:hypothetical protein [Pyrinomonadaceae bacterium]